jgi:hypothetical protein
MLDRVLWIIMIFCVLSSSIEADEIANDSFSLTFQLSVYPDVVRYGEVTFIAIEVKNVNQNSVKIHSVLRETGYSNYEIELCTEDKGRRLLKWLDKNAFDVNENLPDAKRDTSGTITMKKILSGEKILIAFRPVWIPPMNHEGNDFRTQFGNRLTKEASAFWIKSKFYLDNYLSLANDAVRQEKHEPIFEFPDSKIIVNSINENTYNTIREWYMEMPGPYHWTDGVFFQLKDDDKDSQFYLPEHLTGKTRNEARRAINKRLKRYQYYDQPEPRNKFIETRIKRSEELASELLKQPDSELSPHMKEFIVLRGLLVELRYADENELSRNKAFDKIVDWIKTSKFKTTWVLVLKGSGLPSIENTNHFPQQLVNDYINKLSKIFPKEVNATVNELNEEYKNTLLNNPEPVNKTNQNLSSTLSTITPSTTTSSSVSSPSVSERQTDLTNPQKTQSDETSSWNFITVCVVILFILAIAGIIFVLKIFHKSP